MLLTYPKTLVHYHRLAQGPPFASREKLLKEDHFSFPEWTTKHERIHLQDQQTHLADEGRIREFESFIYVWQGGYLSMPDFSLEIHQTNLILFIWLQTPLENWNPHYFLPHQSYFVGLFFPQRKLWVGGVGENGSLRLHELNLRISILHWMPSNMMQCWIWKFFPIPCFQLGFRYLPQLPILSA